LKGGSRLLGNIFCYLFYPDVPVFQFLNIYVNKIPLKKAYQFTFWEKSSDGESSLSELESNILQTSAGFLSWMEINILQRK
jgi:hypothetical protein